MADDKSTHLTIALPRFEGPFDVLLGLIRRNQWSIDDLPVVEITGQFLAYIREAGELDPELAGEFVETASWLVLLKSRSLLPAEDAAAPAPQEELRRAAATGDRAGSACAAAAGGEGHLAPLRRAAHGPGRADALLRLARRAAGPDPCPGPGGLGPLRRLRGKPGVRSSRAPGRRAGCGRGGG